MSINLGRDNGERWLMEAGMDFVAANRVAQALEDEYEGVMVAGFRRTHLERPHDSWAIDIVSPASGKVITVDQKDSWKKLLESAFPEAERRPRR